MKTYTQVNDEQNILQALTLNDDGSFVLLKADNSPKPTSAVEGRYSWNEGEVQLHDFGEEGKVLAARRDPNTNELVGEGGLLEGPWLPYVPETDDVQADEGMVGGAGLPTYSWISELKDSTPIVKMSIPGTHDSGTFKSDWKSFAQCQYNDFNTQLFDGIRWFDLRIGHSHTGSELEFFHGVARCHIRFAEVIEIFKYFLKTNPKEVLFVSIQSEAHEVGDFNKQVRNVLDNYHEFIHPYTTFDTLGPVRRKMILFPSSREIGGIGTNISSLKDNAEFSYLDSTKPPVSAQTTYNVEQLGWENTARKKIGIISKFLDNQSPNDSSFDINNWNHQYTAGVSPAKYAEFINNHMVGETRFFNNSHHHGVQKMDCYRKDIAARIINNNARFK